MSDALKDTAIGVLGLAVFLGFATRRAEHSIEHDLRRTLKGGTLAATIRPQGAFGLLAGQFASVRVTGSRLSADQVPFRIQRGTGIRAHASRLEFDLHDVTLKGTAVRRFSASFPDVSLDAGRALFDERIILRRAGVGRVSAEVSPEQIAVFISRKYPALTSAAIDLSVGTAKVRGAIRVLGVTQQVEATGRLMVRDGRFLELSDLTVNLNGQPASPAFAENMRRSVNPVVDLHSDLGLAEVVHAESVVIRNGYAVVHGRARIPAPNATRSGNQEQQK